MRPEFSARAAALAWKPSCRAAAWTRYRVSGRSEPRPLSAFEAVPTDTSARAATSLIVAAPDLTSSLRKPDSYARSVGGTQGTCQPLWADQARIVVRGWLSGPI